MSIGERIQKVGFQRWYERTLLESHAYLVTAFFGLILALAGMEVLAKPSGFFIGLFMGFTGAAVVMFAAPRYFRMLALAHSLGGRAHCPRCKVYAAFNVLSCGPRAEPQADEPAETDSVWLKVRCRKCGNEWRI